MRDKIETELRFLKVQLNPHFLFNTLNNLYYLTTEKSNRAPQAILQLSEILDYVLHQGKAILVPLENELKQVDNYIALELLRYEDRIQIDKTIEGNIN
jgi:LytS/YehU family sensor histidine kinase